jgi:hypothetical protein
LRATSGLGYETAGGSLVQEDEVVQLSRRLEALERSNRRLRRVAALGLGALVAGALVATHPAVAKEPTVLDCQKLRLLDSQDRVRGMLSCAKDDTPLLALYDANGKARCVVTLDETGYASLGITDENGSPRISIANTDDGPAMILRESKGGSCISFATTKADSAVTVKDSGGRARVNLGVEADGKPVLRLLDESGGELFKKP